MPLYNRCRDCHKLLPLRSLNEIGLRWWLCDDCFSRWSLEDIRDALNAPDNKCYQHGVYSCSDCYPERYYTSDGKLATL